MVDKKTTAETTKTRLDGTEWVRGALGDGSDNFKASPSAIAQTVHGFNIDPATTSGLTLGLTGGVVSFDANFDFNTYEAGTVTLFDNTLNILTLCPDLDSTIEFGVVVEDTNLPSKFYPLSKFGLYFVTTSGGEITAVSDKRSAIQTTYQSVGGINDLSYVKAEDQGDGTFTVTLKPGRIQTIAGMFQFGSAIATIPNDATSYIEVSDDFMSVVSNTSAFTPGRMPLCSVHMVSGAVQNVTDYRGFLFWPGGASGSFTSDDGKTVTVVNGIITVIAD